MLNIYDDKVKEAEAGLSFYQRQLEEAKAQAEDKKSVKGIERWLGYDFESSCSLTPEFAEFRRDIKKHIKKSIGPELELIMPFGSLHFAFSGFIKNKKTGKLVYFSSDDVRGGRDGWYNNLLIRTAEHEKDYTGGSNDWVRLPDIKDKTSKMTQ